MNKILLLGPPGAGKGTQADIICEFLKIPKISTGDMLRSAIASGSELGKKVTDIMNSGGLVSDQIIIELILDRIAQPDCEKGYLFDGGIRTVGQADLCVENNIEFTHVIEIKVDDEVIVDRMSGRRVHPGSGRNYHLIYQPPKNEGVMILPERHSFKGKMTCLKRLNIGYRFIKMKPNLSLPTINLKQVKAP